MACSKKIPITILIFRQDCSHYMKFPNCCTSNPNLDEDNFSHFVLNSPNWKAGSKVQANIIAQFIHINKQILQF